MNLLIKNIHIYSEKRESFGDLRVRHGRITELSKGLAPRSREHMLDASGYFALPGLINSHDHLEMNLFPHLGKPPYPNFYAWAKDIYHPEESPIREILQVSLEDRLWWGAYKNLISGVTTVVHHNPYYRKVFKRKFPIKVLKEYSWSHSLRYGDNLPKAQKKSRGKPYIIHAAEGVDAESSREIEELERIGVLGANTVIVHGIALSEEQIHKLTGIGVRVVWCPASNQFLYGENAPISQMKGCMQIALGTDSTMSGSPTLLDELRAAHSIGMTAPTELLEMVTTNAASIFHLPKGAGTLLESAPADLLLLPDSSESAAETLLNATPADLALVMVDGEPRLADEIVAEELRLGSPNILVEGMPKWTYGNVADLKGRIQKVVGNEFLSRNPLWKLLGSR